MKTPKPGEDPAYDRFVHGWKLDFGEALAALDGLPNASEAKALLFALNRSRVGSEGDLLAFKPSRRKS